MTWIFNSVAMTDTCESGLAQRSVTAGNIQVLLGDECLFNRLDVTVRRGEDGADAVEALDGGRHVGTLVRRDVEVVECPFNKYVRISPCPFT